ncbi:2-iminoacetate synthase [Lachnospiraceae bacterium KM106-2]|nr:2-iminoacetate synthase [Lachnospiraceae bacterium KM106-2]
MLNHDNFVPDEEFIDADYIDRVLEDAKNTPKEEIKRILDKAEAFEGLSHEEVAALLEDEDPDDLERVYEIAGKIKKHIYGDRIVMFAPLYISDYCVNSCRYCGFNCNHKYERKRLTMDEIKDEVRILEKMGHKRLAVEAGEDPENCSIDYVLDCIKTIYGMKDTGEIRRVNVNIAATTVEDFKKLKAAGIGTYILFQETYNKKTYDYMHPAGPKSNYWYHTTAFDRAMEAGIDDVGGGVLYGLHNDPKFEVMGLMLHNEHLEKKFGVGFHTISSPRIRPAKGTDENVMSHGVDDETFKKMVAIVRLAVPFTGMIISTREDEDMRRFLIKIGISQISGGSCVDVGGYAARERNEPQFILQDSRTNGDIVSWLIDEGTIPSFCTACYRSKRTGNRFMSITKAGHIKERCLPNAIMTLKEYACDYGSDEFKEKVRNLIAKKIPDIENSQIRELVTANCERIENGERDLFI